MQELIDRLSEYAAYHRNERNIRTHFIGIPMIGLGLSALLYPLGFYPVGLPVNVTTVTALCLLGYYAKLDQAYAVASALPILVVVMTAAYIASAPLLVWLMISLMLLALGWMQQLMGHKHEGRHPAFLDDVRSIPIGPLFLIAELGFRFGWRLALKHQIDMRCTATQARF